MSVRFSISVPDDLAERLEKFKSSVNISQVCQSCLAAYCDRQDALLRQSNDDTQDDEIIARWTEERAEDRTAAFTLGYEAGVDFVKTAPYSDVLYAINHLENSLSLSKTYGNSYAGLPISDLFQNTILGEFFGHHDIEIGTEFYDDVEVLSYAGASWLEGWFDGATKTFERLSAKLESYED